MLLALAIGTGLRNLRDNKSRTENRTVKSSFTKNKRNIAIAKDEDGDITEIKNVCLNLKIEQKRNW